MNAAAQRDPRPAKINTRTDLATLEDLASGARLPLAARHLIGRSRDCHLCLSTPRVSNVHAQIAWDGRMWRVQDLNSTNGTLVDGRKVLSGEAAPLRVGTEVTFGSPAYRFRLIDDSPPRLMATALDGDVQVEDGGLLCLPRAGELDAAIFDDVGGWWLVEDQDGTQRIEDQDLVLAGGKPWRVSLPGAVGGWPQPARPRGLTIFVCRDGGRVGLSLQGECGNVPLAPAEHSSLLWVLVHRRWSDARRGGVPEVEQGWTRQDDLMTDLVVSAQVLSAWIFRARQQLAETMVRGAARLIERRVAARQLRLGTPRILGLDPSPADVDRAWR